MTRVLAFGAAGGGGRMSCSGSLRPVAAESEVGSLDDVFGSQQQRRRDGKPERFGGLEIDDQLELGGLLHREIGGLRALEDLVHICGSSMGCVSGIWTIGYKATRLGIEGGWVQHRQAVLHKELDDLGGARIENRA